MRAKNGVNFFLRALLAIVMFATLSSCESLDSNNNDWSYHATRTTQRLQRRLGLFDGQASQIYNILMSGVTNHVARGQVLNQIFSVLTPDQQQRLQRMLDSEQWASFGGRRRYSEGLLDWYPRSYQNMAPPLMPPAIPQPLPLSPLPYSVPPSQQPMLAPTSTPIQSINTMYNPRTGETFSPQFKYDPHTGEPLQARQ